MIDVSKEVLAYRSYLRLRNFQHSTVVMYTRTLHIFLVYVQTQFPGEVLTQDHAQHYLLMRVDCGKAWSTINADYSALRKYYKILKDYPWSLKKLPRPKREKKLPAILSKEEVALLIQSASTFKHQVFLTFLYATGVRLSEATHVKIEDIDSDRMQVRIHRGKGAKDRRVVLNQKLLDLLRSYFKIYKPENYLFNGQVKGAAYSSSAGQWSIRRGRSLAGITKKCSIHTLRNCYLPAVFMY
jgi:site-specific recombinase XerD